MNIGVGEEVPNAVGSSVMSVNVVIVLIATRKQLTPAMSDFVVGPTLRCIDIHMYDEMQMVTHHGIAINADGKAGGDFMQALFDPSFPMCVISMFE